MIGNDCCKTSSSIKMYIQPVHSEGDQPWDFFGRNDAKAEAPVLWPPHVKSWLIGKDSDAGRDWGQEKGTTQDEMAGWHHGLDGHESECTPGVGDGQGGLACCDSWGRKESDMTERLNWTELNWEKNIVLPGKGGHNGLMPWKMMSPQTGRFNEEFYSNSSRMRLLIRLGCVCLHSRVC